jgi:hypothetical protein
MLAVRRPLPGSGQIALGWHIAPGPEGREIVWHNGGTGGYRSYVGFDPKNHTGVVVLANTSTNEGVDDIGRYLLDPTAPLLQAPKIRKEIAVDPKVLDNYVGFYELAPKFVLTVTRQGNQLLAQATGQPRVELFAESDREFFYKAVDAQITFQTDDQGRATGLILHQNGDHPAKRVERKEIAVDPKALDGYLGIYDFGPKFALTVTREGNQLFAQATGQRKFELFAESDRKFFYKAFDAQITFQTDEQGRATGLIQHQNGDHPGKRVESHPAAPKTRTEIAVDPTVLERYVGKYQLAPALIITITREGNRLFDQTTGQPRVELFAESDKEFFYKVVDAQVTFQTDDQGRATGLIVHQGGRDHEAKRID